MITNTIDEHYVKQFIKWMKLVIDNIEQHYRIKHRYYFPKLNFPICNELLEDFKPILELLKKSKQHIKNVSILKVKQENNKETLCQHITELYTDIQQIILLIKKNFKREKIKLLPKMIHEINYADIRAIDITKDYNKYNFVISPRGRGLDCHRTWELFLAGEFKLI